MKDNQSDIRILKKINTLLKENIDNTMNNKKEKIYEDEKNENEQDNLEMSENINNINLNKSDESYKSMFSIISLKKEEKEENDFENLEYSSNSKDVVYKRINTTLSQMSINSFSPNNTISFWEAIKLKFNDIKNHFLFNYNIFSNQNNLVNISQKLAKEIQIFDVKYLIQEELLN